MIFPDGADNGLVGHVEAFADQLAFFLRPRHGRFTLPLPDGSFERFLTHDRAVHLFPRKAVKGLGDVGVGDLERIVHLHADDHVGQDGAGSDGAGAAEGFEGGLFDHALVIDFQVQLQSVTAGDATHFADGVGISERSRIMRMYEIILHFFRVIPHS